MSFTAWARSCQAGSLTSTRRRSRAGEARGAAFLADEVEHLGGVERRVFHELQLHRLVRGIDARVTPSGRAGEAHLVALDERAGGSGSRPKRSTSSSCMASSSSRVSASARRL